jgi:hypothetical protein
VYVSDYDVGFVFGMLAVLAAIVLCWAFWGWMDRQKQEGADGVEADET